MDQQINLHAYVEIAKRRKKQMLIPAAAVFICGVLMAILLPSIYRSSATILIETQNISKDVIQTTVSGYVEQRLQSLSQIVLGRVNLMNLISKMNLYAEYKDKLTDEELIEKMRKSILLEPVQADVGNPNAKNVTATIAFEISFDDRDPKKAASVASELASLFLEANLKTREDTANSAVDFLNKQMEELRKDIEAKEQVLSTFKETNLTALPELTQLNLSTMDKMDRDRVSLEEQIRSLQSRKAYLDGQLATIDPYSGAVGPDGARYLSPKEEHERLRRTYMTLRSALSEQHPDVVKVKRQLTSMGNVIAGPQDVKIYADAIRDKQMRLAKLTETVSEKHPDVIALKNEISALSKEMQQAQTNVQMPPRALDEPTNPAYIALKAQVVSTQLELRGVQSQMSRLQSMQLDYQKRLEGAPKVEQEYQGMLRDLETSKMKFRELSGRLMAARESKGLEESQIGDKFSLIAPPLVPEKPIKPKRKLIFLLGFVLAIAVGAGTGLLLETLDHSVRTPEALAAITEAPILAVIPYIEPPREESQDQRLKWRPTPKAIGVGVVALLLLAVHILYDPLDVIVLGVIRKITTLF
ncbi:MAG: lipopolysaccharide biosynthesis [Desulfovibrionaceae bacterium]|nr:MAG: lipopolysaccharide biosynthesis [Desulfovibrionaceae bacterium]